jgi:hypothetical protein
MVTTQYLLCRADFFSNESLQPGSIMSGDGKSYCPCSYDADAVTPNAGGSSSALPNSRSIILSLGLNRKLSEVHLVVHRPAHHWHGLKPSSSAEI